MGVVTRRWDGSAWVASLRPTPTFVATSNAASTATVSAPSGITEGDLLIHAVAWDYNAGRVDDYQASGWWPLGSGSTAATRLSLSARWVVSGEPSSYTRSSSDDYNSLHVITAYRGVRLVVPLAYGDGSGDTASVPSFDTVEDNALLVLVGAAHCGSGPVWTFPTGFTEDASSSRWYPAIGVGSKEQAIAGSTGSLSLSVTSYHRDRTQGVGLALYP